MFSEFGRNILIPVHSFYCWLHTKKAGKYFKIKVLENAFFLCCSRFRPHYIRGLYAIFLKVWKREMLLYAVYSVLTIPDYNNITSSRDNTPCIGNDAFEIYTVYVNLLTLIRKAFTKDHVPVIQNHFINLVWRLGKMIDIYIYL